ncbi:uncharacterized protein LOC123009499 [Tribolium madens]|uniref:uncharacterized protein LOC123009499 n=1 Tax=Tribolium madens TaxID=41895 RepID=UPI001CF73D28|nr:uncharacterized protein LOC123009499 [Tribolium madens]
MPIRTRKRTPDIKQIQNNGLYIHSSPPRVLQLTSAHIKQLIRSGDVEKLEQLVVDGLGKKLLGEYSADYKTRTFLKNVVPTLMTKISLLHDAVNSGRLEELKSLLEEEPIERRRRLVTAKDDFGVGLLHKAIYYDLKNIYKYLIDKFPHVVSLKDSEGRTAFHYTPMCKDAAGVQKLLISAGADSSCVDLKQHTAKYYMTHIQELELPNSRKSASSTKSAPPHESLNFKKSNIRIWIHQRNLVNLQQVVWEGHGAKLLPEHSNNPKIKKFLEAVPHIMGIIKDIHSDVINDELENLTKRLEPPIPSLVLSGKDSNGLTPLHKASGLGRQEIAQFLVTQYPSCVNLVDSEGRTPLHYAALVKDNGQMMGFLLQHEADESALDNRQKTAAYYKTRASELDSKLLSVIPEAPRTAKESFLGTFDWGLLLAATPTEEIHKVVKKIQNGTEKEEPSTEKKQEGVETENDHKENGNDANDHNEEEEHDTKEDEEMNDNKENGEVNDNKEEQEYKNEDEELNDNKEEEEEDKNEDEELNDNKGEEEENKNEDEELNDDKGEEEENKNEDEELNDNKEDEENKREETEPNDNKDEEQPEEPNNNEPEKSPEVPPVEPEEVIEGVVNGENEIETLNEQGPDSNSGDPEITKMVESGNMEQLAALVLNGEGERLVGQSSDNPELQSFLDNVQVYMSKINRIHVAARDGSLRDLQAALDRRKFAIAKDKVSPNGASPLHVAVVFANTSIVRYLAGRFPETAQVRDDNARTPLHYAAVLPDNGHYYNLLVHLGADSRSEDKFGHSPEYYRRNQEEFSHRSLLRDFGAEESASEEMLSDKGVVASNQVDMPFFATEEGRYLASSLGDPLIKGLTEVANKRPEDPIAYLATYLYNFANNRQNVHSRGKTQQENQQTITGPPQEDNNKAVPASIEIVTVDPEDSGNEEDSAFSSTSRDEHGQSMLHFAAARAHGRNALFQLLTETEINVAYRDELYRTARDISIQANIPENTIEIDRYVMSIATKGDTDKLVELLLDGYDHITDIVDENGVPIVEAVAQHNQPDAVSFLQSILAFEEKRERVHHAIRLGSINDVTALLADENETGSGKLLAIGKNSYGRCSLHIAVLCQQEEIADYLANTFPDTLKLGDNLERTALHYAMGVEKMETISRVLIKAGSKRIVKDLKGRQPTYYFLNKSDILRLQEEEETF